MFRVWDFGLSIAVEFGVAWVWFRGRFRPNADLQGTVYWKLVRIFDGQAGRSPGLRVVL